MSARIRTHTHVRFQARTHALRANPRAHTRKRTQDFKHGRTHSTNTQARTHPRTRNYARAHPRTHARTVERTHAQTHTRTHVRHSRSHALHAHARTHFIRTLARARTQTRTWYMHARKHLRTDILLQTQHIVVKRMHARMHAYSRTQTVARLHCARRNAHGRTDLRAHAISHLPSACTNKRTYTRTDESKIPSTGARTPYEGTRARIQARTQALTHPRTHK